MIYRINQEQIDAYFESESISQSRLKDLLKSPVLFSLGGKDYAPNPSFITGSAVDCLITQSKEEFDEIYHITQLESKPSDAVSAIIQMVFDHLKQAQEQIEDRLSLYKEEIYHACNSLNYYPKRMKENWEEDTRPDSVIKVGQEYFAELINSDGKQILSKAEYEKINNTYLSLINHSHTENEFKDDLFTDIIYQLPIYFSYKEVPCRALLDMVKIDHEGKTIRVKDIKTMSGHTNTFLGSVKSYRYDFQAAFYMEAISQARELIEEITGKDTSNYTVTGFDWIVESTTNQGCPLIYTADIELIRIGRMGRLPVHYTKPGKPLTKYKLQSELHGFDYAIELYKWHLEEGFDYQKDISMNGGNLIIDWNGVK